MPPFCFWDPGSSLLSLLWILFQVGCLFPHLFGLVGFLPCSFICDIFFCHLIFFFLGWDCVPVLLVVQPEASSTGVCRLLGRAESWCQDEDLWETSLQWVIPWGLRSSVSPVVQTWSSHHRSSGMTPSLWTKILQAMQGSKKKNKKRSWRITKSKKENKIRKLTDMLEKIKI